MFVAAGQEGALSNSRGPESLRSLVAELGPRAHAMTIADAARFGDVVLLAVPWRTPEALPAPEILKGKIVIDAMNPYRADSGFYDLGNSTSSEEVLKRIPGARLVKALNTIYYQHLATRGRNDLPVEDRHAIYLAGDDEPAKQVVCRLIKEIAFPPLDPETLPQAANHPEPETDIYNKTMTGREAREFLQSQTAQKS